LNSKAVQQADQALKSLKNAISAKKPMKAAAEAAQNAVLSALQVNNPSPATLDELRGSALTPEEATLSRRTNDVADLLEELLASAAREALYQYQIMQTRIRVAGALEHPRATLVGDARFVVERYARDVYQVDFDFLWPRLLVAMKAEKADDSMLDTIETARSKVDFAVLSLVLAASVPAVWLLTLLIRGGPAWLFLTIGAATPPALVFFNELVFEGQLAFGEIVKTAIDKSRFLVLKMLRQPDPLSRGEERRLWARIAEAEKDGRVADLVYFLSTPVPK
jgi:hypothetical protein